MYELQVEGMSCSHCINAVTQAVQDVDAGARVNVVLAEQKVSIASEADLERIKSAIEEAGYPVLRTTTT